MGKYSLFWSLLWLMSSDVFSFARKEEAKDFTGLINKESGKVLKASYERMTHKIEQFNKKPIENCFVFNDKDINHIDLCEPEIPTDSENVENKMRLRTKKIDALCEGLYDEKHLEKRKKESKDTQIAFINYLKSENDIRDQMLALSTLELTSGSDSFSVQYGGKKYLFWGPLIYLGVY